MDLDLVVATADGATPVTVRADDHALVGDLRRALDMPDVPFPVADDVPLAESGLVRGSFVHLTGTAPGEHETARPDLEIAVVGGLHAGATAPVPPGRRVTIGRAPRCDLVVPDAEVSREHAVLHAENGTVTVRDTGSRNGIRRGGWRIDEADLPPGEVFGLGETVLAVREPVRADGDVSDPVAGELMFNRPPRIAVPDKVPELVVPHPPAPPGGFHFPWLMTVVPLVVGGVLYLVLPSGGYGMYLLLMMGLSPLMMVANLVSSRWSGRREYKQLKAAYDLAKESFDAALDAAAHEEQSAERAGHPDPAALVGMAERRASTLWQRRRTDPDFLRLRIGLVNRPATVVLRSETAQTELPAPPTVYDVPVTVELSVLGVAGPRDATLAAARALLIRTAVLHAPADLGVVVLTGRDDAPEWEWASWLPHTLPSSSAFACARMVAADAPQAETRLAELQRLIDERMSERRSVLSDGPPAGRAVLVVLDGARRLRDLPGLAQLLATGPAAGVYALCLDAEETSLPDECRATVVITGTRAQVRRPGLPPVENVLVDGLLLERASSAALALAPLRALGERGGDSALPDRVRFTELAGAGPAWQRSPEGRSTTALIGIGPNGPLTVDLRRDGPHALIAGTSGSGKSELLQTLVASLALVNAPDALTFVLVDYKGGSAFAACADLPHCVGMVTDLDGHEVNRALDSLSAELRRREALLADAGAKDIDDYWARTGARLPRLVIVIDEFASLVEEVPDFVPGVVGIGMRGRSLGVHVVLATQRPAGVVTADLRANVNLRISLRVTASAESVDVIDAADAARIPARQPGRAYLRTGHSELTAFQAARVGWPRTTTTGPVVTVQPRHMSVLGGTLWSTARDDESADGRTDLTDLVDAIRKTATDQGLDTPPRPWLPPLPELVPLAALPTSPAHGAAIGLVDRPTAQAQDAFVVDLERTGPLAVAGAVRAGRSTLLRTLAATLADGSSPADLHLYGLDCGNRALSCLLTLPHCGAIVDGEDTQRVERLLDLFDAEVARRQRRLAAGGHGGLAEQRAAAAPDDRLPHVVLLLDRLESFVNRYTEIDGGRLIDRVETLLRTGPAVGVTVVLTTDRTGFGHRIASAVASRLVLRQAAADDVAAFGLDPRRMPRNMPAGRAVWVDTGEQVQIAVLDPDPSGGAQSAAVDRLGAELTARWDGVAERLLPRRVDPLPVELTTTELDALRRVPRPRGALVCTPAAGGDHLGPVDVDLSATAGTFFVAGPSGSGRSTALAAMLESLADSSLPVLVVAPRSSPLRDMADFDVLTGDPADIAVRITDASATGPLALVVDDGELITGVLGDVLEQFAREARDNGSALIAAGTTADVMANPFRGWLAAVRRSRSGLLLTPGSHVDGEVFELRLPRSTAGSWPPGRGLLVVRGATTPVQVPLPAIREAS